MAQSRPPSKVPKLATFGNTLASPIGTDIEEGLILTSIDSKKLNTDTESSTEEFSPFETTLVLMKQ